jgi:hypothetical protein
MLASRFVVDAYLFQEFISWLENWIGSEAFNKIPKDKVRHGSSLMNQFENMKTHFSGDEENMEIRLPGQCGITDDEGKNIDDGHLMLSADQMKQFFEPSIRRTLELIDGQVKAIDVAMKPKPKARYLITINIC